MEKIKEILLIVPIFFLVYSLLCLIISLLFSFFRFVFRKEPFYSTFKTVFLNLFLEILNPFNYLF
ncbi:hypothetical protein FQS90_12400 [Enterococcus casseliflavus]|jgi:hypothetical protein|nr:hypothetical protein [Enterococcus casseliflavus]MBO1144445.1 hypothetical protein [Enterococcus casseliflavus]OTO34949.1 hypothetical protein A5870_002319 [Enterococcus sp. 2G9_DIV0600]OTO37801.1 hypothetical protein A5871_002369 [Enterococcus sp. 2F9_DIV0599]OUZ36137.1 hypothetical protein A5885_000322 [Enterococcus sp. 8E11_MSG4843]